MKQAYVSVVLTSRALPLMADLRKLDAILARVTRAHEIVIATPSVSRALDLDPVALTGPISIVTTHPRSSRDDDILAGMGRAVGDFVIEWRGPIEGLDDHVIEELLVPSESGVELVEVVTNGSSAVSGLVNGIVNVFRPKGFPIRKTLARVFSRRVVQVLLAGRVIEPQLDVLVAELPSSRSVMSVAFKDQHQLSVLERSSRAVARLSSGTRAGSAIPLALAIMSAVFGLAAAVYALLVLFVRGETPEGWTTLMVVIGLGQAAIFAMLGLIWSRVDALARGLVRNPDTTADVVVIAPVNWQEAGSDYHS